MASIVLSWVDLSVSIRFFWYSDSGRVFGWSLFGVLLSIRSIRSPRLWLDDESRSRAVQFGRVFDRDLTFELVVWLDSEVEDGRMHVLVWKEEMTSDDLKRPQMTSIDPFSTHHFLLIIQIILFSPIMNFGSTWAWSRFSQTSWLDRNLRTDLLFGQHFFKFTTSSRGSSNSISPTSMLVGISETGYVGDN